MRVAMRTYIGLNLKFYKPVVPIFSIAGKNYKIIARFEIFDI